MLQCLVTFLTMMHGKISVDQICHSCNVLSLTEDIGMGVSSVGIEINMRIYLRTSLTCHTNNPFAASVHWFCTCPHIIKRWIKVFYGHLTRAVASVTSLVGGGGRVRVKNSDCLGCFLLLCGDSTPIVSDTRNSLGGGEDLKGHNPHEKSTISWNKQIICKTKEKSWGGGCVTNGRTIYRCHWLAWIVQKKFDWPQDSRNRHNQCLLELHVPSLQMWIWCLQFLIFSCEKKKVNIWKLIMHIRWIEMIQES